MEGQKLFHKDNPPQTKRAADDRLHALKRELEKERDEKRKEAIQTELHFLKGWVKERMAFATKARRTRSAELKEKQKQIRERAEELAKEIRTKHYAEVKYRADQVPESEEAAKERLAYLEQVRNELHTAFVGIKKDWSRYPFKHSDFTEVRAPLCKLCAEVEQEMAIVKAALPQGATIVPNLIKVRSDMLAHILKALRRAKDAGYKLTPREQAILEQLEKSLSENADSPPHIGF